MKTLELNARHSILKIHSIDKDKEIEIENSCYDVSVWLSVEQAKELINFLTEQCND